MKNVTQIAKALKEVKMDADRAYWTASFMQGLAEYMSMMLEGAAQSLASSVTELEGITEESISEKSADASE